MREILFRAKEEEYGEWLEGYYAIVGDKHVIIRKELDTYYSPDHDYEERRGAEIVRVLPQTVGQFTGFYDKHGKKIFEGDILGSRYDEDCPDDVCYELVKWIGNGWYSGEGTPDEDLRQDLLNKYSELVGNIWDDPELQGVK